MENNNFNFIYQYSDMPIPQLCGDGMNPLERYKNYLCGTYTKRKTITSYLSSARQLIRVTDNQINEETIQKYQYYINQYYQRQNSRRIRLHGANQYLKFINSNIQLKLPPQENTNQRTLNETQIDTILEISKYNPETHLILMLLWDGCLRPHSIIKLKISDRNDNKLYLNQTKTGNRHIIMSNPLISAWDNYLEQRPSPNPEHQEYLLINNWITFAGTKYQSTYNIVKTIKRLGILAGVPFKITPYTVRRTSATLRQNKFSKYYAGDPKLVQRMFNHSDIRTTMRYNQITDNDIENYLNHVYIQTDKPYMSSQNNIKDVCVEKDNNEISFSTVIFSSNFFDWVERYIFCHSNIRFLSLKTINLFNPTSPFISDGNCKDGTQEVLFLEIIPSPLSEEYPCDFHSCVTIADGNREVRVNLLPYRKTRPSFLLPSASVPILDLKFYRLAYEVNGQLI